MAVLFITHDISVVVQTCDTVAVMYGGLVLERGPVREVFREPVHPYTMGLTNAFPTLEGAVRELVSIPGAPPDLLAPPQGCRFAQRCPFVTDRCREEAPPLAEVAPGRWAPATTPSARPSSASRPATSRPGAAVGERLGEVVETAAAGRARAEDGPLFEVVTSRDTTRCPVVVVGAAARSPDTRGARGRRGLVRGPARRDPRPRGRVGIGQDHHRRDLVRLQDPTSGSLAFEGAAVERLHGARLKAFRRHAQMVFQDPYETLNPR
jgi:peptide/nickel transport system ATP-binding protein